MIRHGILQNSADSLITVLICNSEHLAFVPLCLFLIGDLNIIET